MVSGAGLRVTDDTACAFVRLLGSGSRAHSGDHDVTEKITEVDELRDKLLQSIRCEAWLPLVEQFEQAVRDEEFRKAYARVQMARAEVWNIVLEVTRSSDSFLYISLTDEERENIGGLFMQERERLLSARSPDEQPRSSPPTDQTDR